MKFVSYSSEQPNLCRGTLVLDDDNGMRWHLVDMIHSSSVIWSYEDLTGCEPGPWFVDRTFLPDCLKPFHDEIVRLVNENVPWGCCSCGVCV